MDKLKAMETFAAIVDKGSLTAAAEALGTSLPSVVRVLASLERDLNVRLLNRTTRRLHLTEEGALYLEQCRLVLAAIRDAETLLASRKTEPQGTLRVTAPMLFGRRYIVPIVNEFASLFPALRIDLLLLDRVVDLLEEGLDVGVRIGHLEDSSLIAHEVGRVRRVVCASPSYLRSRGTPKTPADVRTHRCVHFASASGRDEWQFRDGRRTLNVPIDIRIVCNQAEAAIDACVAGLGLGSFISYQVAPNVAARTLRYVLTDYEPAPVPISVVYPHSRLQTAKVKRFVGSATSVLRKARFD